MSGDDDRLTSNPQGSRANLQRLLASERARNDAMERRLLESERARKDAVAQRAIEAQRNLDNDKYTSPHGNNRLPTRDRERVNSVSYSRSPE